NLERIFATKYFDSWGENYTVFKQSSSGGDILVELGNFRGFFSSLNTEHIFKRYIDLFQKQINSKNWLSLNSKIFPAKRNYRFKKRLKFFKNRLKLLFARTNRLHLLRKLKLKRSVKMRGQFSSFKTHSMLKRK